MRAVVTRVSSAAVAIEGRTVGAIDRGFLVLLGVGPEDTEAICDKLAEKICNLRVFEDENGKMNRDLSQVGGSLLNAVGIGSRTASGPLCVCRSQEDVATKFHPGDVLVVPYTTNDLLSYIRQAAAVISEESGLNSHAATVGLTLDKAVIVGATGATQRLRDGTMVSVDCVRGVVQTLPQ